MPNNIKNYEVWTLGVRKGNLIIKTDSLLEAHDQQGNNQGSVLINILAVNKTAAVIKATETLRSNEKVIVAEIENEGMMTTVEDLIGDIHKVELSNLRFE